MGFSKLENRGVKIFRRNFPGKLLGEFRVEWVFVHPDPTPVGVAEKQKKGFCNFSQIKILRIKTEFFEAFSQSHHVELIILMYLMLKFVTFNNKKLNMGSYREMEFF